MKKFTIFIIIFTAIIPVLYSQSPEVFAPFVSRLRTEVKSNGILLTWQDSRDLEGSYVIYRHTAQISEKNIKEAAVAGEAASGVMSFLDTPLRNTNFYYAVIAKSKEGVLYEIYIPFRNISTVPAAVKGLLPETELAAKITGISASVEKDGIKLKFNSSKTDRDLIIFRSDRPIKTGRDINHATVAANQKSNIGLYTDFPVPGIEYYYAVIDAGLLQSGEVSFTVNENSMEKSVQVPVTDKRKALAPPSVPLRPQPLPYLAISSDIYSGKELSASLAFNAPSRKTLKSETAAAVNELMAKIKTPETLKPEPVILPEDKYPGESGEDKLLQALVSTYITEGRITEAQQELDYFLSLRHSPQVESRAHFYRAQVYYYKNEYLKAFMEFLLADSLLYTHSRPFINSILTEIRKNSTIKL